MGGIGIERIGMRLYVTGDAGPIRDRLVRARCHWDDTRGQWWIGSGAGRRAILEAIVGSAGAAAPPGETPAAPADRRAAVPAELHRELADAIRLARGNRDGSECAEDLVDRLERIAALIAVPGGDDAGGTG